MRYYKVRPVQSFFLYCVVSEEDDSYFWYYPSEYVGWLISKKTKWFEYLKEVPSPEEVCKLEVVVACGSLPE